MKGENSLMSFKTLLLASVIDADRYLAKVNVYHSDVFFLRFYFIFMSINLSIAVLPFEWISIVFFQFDKLRPI